MTNIIGQTILDQFRVDAFIASGGMGAVYRVWDLKRNVSLAMKVLHTDLAEDEHVFQRFQREANALKKLTHPNIVPFYGLYITEHFAFLLERFIDGPSLQYILKERQGRLSLKEALTYLKALCAALGYAHAYGVVHCDIKPANVMVDSGGNIYLTDFGVARHAESSATTFGVAGTPAYMAPEQIRDEALSAATDVYALGVMLFEMLTGKRPFSGAEPGTELTGSSTGERLRYAHIHLAPPNPRAFNPEISEQLAGVILCSLAKDPAERFPSSNNFFLAVCASAGLEASGIPERVAALPVGEREQVSAPAAPPVSSRKPPYALFGVAGLAVLVACAGLVWLVSRFAPLAAATPIFATPTAAPAMPVPLTATAVPFAIEPFTQTPALPTEISIPIFTPTIAFTPTVPSKAETNAKDGAPIVLIPAGEFTMGSDASTDPNFWGSEGPIHQVYLDAYYIYQTEVTNGLYKKCVAAKACRQPRTPRSRQRKSYYGNAQFENYPVLTVTWQDAKNYCKWAGGRLPSEAEWEKAARGIDGRLFPWGNEVNSKGRAAKNGLDTEAVGKYLQGASPYGVYDMAGNVLEWVNDYMGAEFYKISPDRNPAGPDFGSRYIIRGGSWYSKIDGLRTVARASLKPDEALDTVGFRCAVNAP